MTGSVWRWGWCWGVGFGGVGGNASVGGVGGVGGVDGDSGGKGCDGVHGGAYNHPMVGVAVLGGGVSDRLWSSSVEVSIDRLVLDSFTSILALGLAHTKCSLQMW